MLRKIAELTSKKVELVKLGTQPIQRFTRDIITEKGKAEEEYYFSKKDKILISKLSEKMKNELPREEKITQNAEDLVEILKRHNTPCYEGLVLDLLEWKEINKNQ